MLTYIQSIKQTKKHLTGRAVLLQFKGQGPVGSSFTGHLLPVRNDLHLVLTYIQSIKPKQNHLTGRAVLLQFEGQGPVGSSFTGHHLLVRN